MSWALAVNRPAGLAYSCIELFWTILSNWGNKGKLLKQLPCQRWILGYFHMQETVNMHRCLFVASFWQNVTVMSVWFTLGHLNHDNQLINSSKNNIESKYVVLCIIITWREVSLLTTTLLSWRENKFYYAFIDNVIKQWSFICWFHSIALQNKNSLWNTKSALGSLSSLFQILLSCVMNWTQLTGFSKTPFTFYPPCFGSSPQTQTPPTRTDNLPLGTNKVFSNWIEPGKKKKKLSLNSYLPCMGQMALCTLLLHKQNLNHISHFIFCTALLQCNTWCYIHSLCKAVCNFS